MQHNFVTTNVLSRQAYFCRGKHVVVATKHVFCRDKSMLVTTNICRVGGGWMEGAACITLVCHTQSTSHVRQAHKHWHKLPQVSFIIIKIRLLSRQKYTCRVKTFVATNICRDKHTFVATKDVFCRNTPRVCHDKTFVVTSFVVTKLCRTCLSRQT